MNAVYLVDAVRTPIGRYAGALSSIRPDDLLAFVIKGLLARHPGLDPAAIEEVIAGAANQAGEDNRNVARMAALLAGLPVSVAGITVNRLCASGLQAVIDASRAIQVGDGDMMIAGGVESMTRAPFVTAKSEQAFGRLPDSFDTTRRSSRSHLLPNSSSGTGSPSRTRSSCWWMSASSVKVLLATME